MDHPMNSKPDDKTRSFMDCSLQVMKGESSLQVQEIGQCFVNVVQDYFTKTCSVQVSGTKKTVFKKSLEFKYMLFL